MKRLVVCALALAALSLCACARLEFEDGKGLTYYDGKPYLFVSLNKDCVPSASLLMLPGEERHVRFVPGYGTADLSVAMTNGMITNVGQKTDTTVPATLTSLAGLTTASAGVFATLMEEKKAAGARVEAAAVACPQALLYPIVGGKPDMASGVAIPLHK